MVLYILQHLPIADAKQLELDERFVKNAVMKYLGKKFHYYPESISELRMHGVDLHLRNKHGFDFKIEAKGGKEFDEGAFIDVLGQIVTRVDRAKAARYGIAFPSSWKKRVLSRVPSQACFRLYLFLFFVDIKGRVEMMPPIRVKLYRQETGFERKKIIQRRGRSEQVVVDSIPPAPMAHIAHCESDRTPRWNSWERVE